ncbi:MAG: hypothetical protein WC668_04280 [Patescibacteria group bacterium]|jgi:hypothetical protein
MKPWFKNGCWGVAVATILALASWIICIIVYAPDFKYWAQPLWLFFSFPGAIIIGVAMFLMFDYYPPRIIDSFSLILSTAISMGIYFLFGLFVGWIIKKIKTW